MTPAPGPDRRRTAPRQAWEQELQAMEAHLAAQREAFSFRDAAYPPARTPGGPDELGPLPEDLRRRAEALLRATRALEGEVADARASVGRALRHARGTARRPAAYVDARG